MLDGCILVLIPPWCCFDPHYPPGCAVLLIITLINVSIDTCVDKNGSSFNLTSSRLHVCVWPAPWCSTASWCCFSQPKPWNCCTLHWLFMRMTVENGEYDADCYASLLFTLNHSVAAAWLVLCSTQVPGGGWVMLFHMDSQAGGGCIGH